MRFNKEEIVSFIIFKINILFFLNGIIVLKCLCKI